MNKQQDRSEFAEAYRNVADSFRTYVMRQLRRAWERADLIERRAKILKTELNDIGTALKSGAIDPDTARADMEKAGILPTIRSLPHDDDQEDTEG
jgi:hypothetical protein